MMKYFLILLLFPATAHADNPIFKGRKVMYDRYYNYWLTNRKITKNNASGSFSTGTIMADSSLIAGDSIFVTGTITNNITITGLQGTESRRVYINFGGSAINRGNGNVTVTNCTGVYVAGILLPLGWASDLYKLDSSVNYITLDGGKVFTRDVAGIVFDTRSDKIYTGALNSYRRGIEIKNFWLQKMPNTVVYNNQGIAKDGKSLIMYFSFHDNIIDSATGGGEALHLLNIYNSAIYNNVFLHIDTCYCNHSTTIYYQGSCDIFNNKFINCRGDDARGFGLTINDGILRTDTMNRWHHNVSLTQRSYPMFEPNLNASDTGGIYKGGLSVYYKIQHNTMGLSTQCPGCGFGFGGMCAPFAPNIAFNFNAGWRLSRDITQDANPANWSGKYMFQTGTGGLNIGWDSSNNYYDTTLLAQNIGFQDTNNVIPKSTSFLIDKETSPPSYEKFDFYGTTFPWNGKGDGGAVEWHPLFITSGSYYKK